MRRFIALLAILLCFPAASAFAEKAVIIVHPKNTATLSEMDIKRIYMGAVTQWPDGSRIAVYNLPVDHPARETFARKILGMSAQEFERDLNNRKITNSETNPQRTKDATLVPSVVEHNTNAIGYVPSTVAANVKNARVVLTVE